MSKQESKNPTDGQFEIRMIGIPRPENHPAVVRVILAQPNAYSRVFGGGSPKMARDLIWGLFV